MNQPNRLIVRATIPSIDNPNAHVLHETGTLPAGTAEIRESAETVLHSLGRQVLQGGYLSIDEISDRRNIAIPFSATTINVTEMTAKPVDRSQVSLAQGYYWSDK